MKTKWLYLVIALAAVASLIWFVAPMATTVLKNIDRFEQMGRVNTDTSYGVGTSISGVSLQNGQPDSIVLSGNLLVSEWATWCGPCLAEMPDLLALERSGLRVRFINYQSVAAVLPFVQEKQLGIEGVVVDSSRSTFIKTGFLPTNYLVKNGRVVHTWIAQQDWKTMRPEIDSLLKVH